VCDCSFTAKSRRGLAAHKRRCSFAAAPDAGRSAGPTASDASGSKAYEGVLSAVEAEDNAGVILASAPHSTVPLDLLRPKSASKTPPSVEQKKERV
jgi:hypothetical protein